MNIRNAVHVFAFALASGAFATALARSIVAQQVTTAKPVEPSPATARAALKVHQESEGERAFAENCSRCHTAPDGFSQRISGTVVRHMRVRASLSEQDERALLRFFNPQ